MLVLHVAPVITTIQSVSTVHRAPRDTSVLLDQSVPPHASHVGKGSTKQLILPHEFVQLVLKTHTRVLLLPLLAPAVVRVHSAIVVLLPAPIARAVLLGNIKLTTSFLIILTPFNPAIAPAAPPGLTIL